MTSHELTPNFAGLVRGEVRKISRQRSNWPLLSLAVVIGLVAGLVLSTGPTFRDAILHNPPQWYHGMNVVAFGFIAPILGGIVVLITSARLVAMEYSSGAIRVVLARGPGRLEFHLAKLTALAIFIVLLLLLFLVFEVIYVGIMVPLNGGSLTAVASLPSWVWRDVGVHVLTAAISLSVCALIGSAASAVGRSMAFGMAVAIGFFPASNFVTEVISIFSARKPGFWAQLTTYLLSANLNVLPETLGHLRESMFTRPLIPVDVAHSLAVIGAYCLAFLAVGAVASRRDILE
ncbi:MAG: ABC transporter permease [Candidatus Dormibacteraeota bacterium]|nr:ABC transporter permease [Candidatus Dormibacteraeota bacterium]